MMMMKTDNDKYHATPIENEKTNKLLKIFVAILKRSSKKHDKETKYIIYLLG